eukprot:TRINITY_DN39432_c0_g1_i1.p1 TRINITY_DN39432_c0_g1~~TRINITY_DN39432_c0_g1_i1.p1  ORF type:complete len:507 (+),score=101.38 TRINITY_DN39432_c0_g1_i1:32-1552(+)
MDPASDGGAASASDDAMPKVSSIASDSGDCMLMVSAEVPAGGARLPADICCVVDVSGSMGEKATYEVDGVQKDDGLSILDIVKHAVKTVMHTLQDDDMLSLVAFDDKAKTVLPLTSMTADGREQAIQALESLQPGGQTNLWDGLLAGMQALQGHVGKSQKSILLLTDGLPTISPPFGHLRELKSFKESAPDFQFQINTFGFGYSLDSEMLLELAMEGNGTYAFIPDAVIVGTVFVNAVANVLSTHTQNAKLHLVAKGGTEFTDTIPGDHAVAGSGTERVLHLGPLQVGQRRDVVIPLRLAAGADPFLEIGAVYSSPDGCEHRASLEIADRTCVQSSLASLRNQTVSVGYSAVKDASSGRGAAAQKSVQGLAARLEEAAADPALAALKVDVTGRMSKAMKGKERFNRWGKHYLRALMRAHQLQVCTNFMDPGLQVYGGELFKKLREEGDHIFLSLPPPKASRKAPATPAPAPAAPAPSRSTAVATPTSRPRSPSPAMKTYYAGSGGG